MFKQRIMWQIVPNQYSLRYKKFEAGRVENFPEIIENTITNFKMINCQMSLDVHK